MGAVVALILREYFAYKSNLRNERIQRYEKLIENVYGQLKASMDKLKGFTDMHPSKFMEEMRNIEEIFVRYGHEIRLLIREHYDSLKETYHPESFKIKDESRAKRHVEEITDCVNQEYYFAVSNLIDYRKMREGSLRNLSFYINPFIFRKGYEERKYEKVVKEKRLKEIYRKLLREYPGIREYIASRDDKLFPYLRDYWEDFRIIIHQKIFWKSLKDKIKSSRK